MKIPPNIKAHIYATGLFVLVSGAAYTAYNVAMEFRKWSMSAPRLQHQEMEDYLRYKDEQARRKMAQQ
ncbi:hypothetical protein L5515_012921 [Caenorhabditis briggsae]|uniref:Uncharacterized protein n=1 Tax=Caenorhabditis briggsae TaxID=6238 RepID=A0AAE9D826_CAEBR|nr:hypothetical protein L3Y34_005833 [Caenorhabditis briggsae]UMM31452.1 hypothetical protein L5515_012921 [Caenorhabditis briggsae]